MCCQKFYLDFFKSWTSHSFQLLGWKKHTLKKITFESLSIFELKDGYKSGQFSPVDVVKSKFDKIEELNPSLNAFCYLDREFALKKAKESEKRWLSECPKSVLDGIPCGIKDVTSTNEWFGRKGSKTVQPGKPPFFEPPMIARLRESGAIFLGLTNTAEFGWKAITDNGLYGPTRNPWNSRLTPGGSSGGSSVAVATDMCTFATASDAAGSIRIPASFCGIFGLKPSYGIIPTFPLSSYGTLSHQGVLTRTAQETHAILKVITQKDPNGAFHIPIFEPQIESLKGLDKIKVGYFLSAENSSLEPVLRDIFLNKIEFLIQCGLDISLTNLPLYRADEIIKKMWAAYLQNTIKNKDKALIDPGIIEFLNIYKDVALSDYIKCQEMRVHFSAHINKIFGDYDFIISPTTLVLPFSIGQNCPNKNEIDWFKWAQNCYPFNLTQQPAASLNCGLSENGLPIGLQVVGKPYDDARLLSFCSLLESYFDQPKVNL